MGLTNPPDLEIKDRLVGWGAVILLALIAGILGLWLGNAEAQLQPAYTDAEIVQAIWRAEGGDKAQFPYGIRSVKCETKEACKKICESTVRRNRDRYAKAGVSERQDFISFLAGRYAPISAGNDPRGLNKNWLKNVMYFLSKNDHKD